MAFPGAWAAAGRHGQRRAGACRWHAGSAPASGTLAGVERFRGCVFGASWAPPVGSRGLEWASRGAGPSPGRALPSGAARAVPAPSVSTWLRRLPRTCLALPRGSASRPLRCPHRAPRPDAGGARVPPALGPFLAALPRTAPGPPSRGAHGAAHWALGPGAFVLRLSWPSLTCFSYRMVRPRVTRPEASLDLCAFTPHAAFPMPGAELF